MATVQGMKLHGAALAACMASALTFAGCDDEQGSGDQDAAPHDAGAHDAGPHRDGAVDPPDAATQDGGVDAGAGEDGGVDAAVDAGARGAWYEAHEPLHIKLVAPFAPAFAAAHAGEPDGIVPPVRSKEPFAGDVAYAFATGRVEQTPVEVAVRGNSSLQECAFPKLKLTFDARRSDPDDVFVGIKKIKLGTHCGEEETVNGTIGRLRNQLATWREEVVYQLARAVGIVTLQTRPATFDYVDSSSQTDQALQRKAFLLEHIDELARRLGATALDDPTDCGADPNARPNARDVLRVKMFHALVGNWDWQVGPPENGGCGALVNTEVLVHPDGSLTLVPADFDLAAFVVGLVRNPDNNRLEPITASNATAAAQAALSNSLQGENSGAVQAMKAELREKRAQLLSLVDASLMDAEGKRAGKLLIEGFFGALDR